MPYRNRNVERAIAKIVAGDYPHDRGPDRYQITFHPNNLGRFRVSSLPYCPILHVEAELAEGHSRIPFESGFYFHAGHAVHHLYQAIAKHAIPNKFIGDWRCSRILQQNSRDNSDQLRLCNRVVPFTSFAKAAQAVCPHGKQNCGGFLEYQELQLNDLDVSGHTDFLLHQAGRHYSLIDFKTTGSFLFDKPKIAIKLGYYPSEKYLHQIENYAIMLERQYKIIIDDVTIAYQAREKATQIGRSKLPAQRLFTYRHSNKIRRRSVRNLRGYRQAYRVANKWLQAKDRKSITPQLLAARPCHRALDYVNKMAWGFFSREPCPHHQAGACYGQRPKIAKIIRKLETTPR